MKISLQYQDKTLHADLSKGHDISIKLVAGEGPNCFYAPLFESSPVRSGDFVGSTKEGGLVNFYNIRLNPHGNGTHTECVGHIATEKLSIVDVLKTSHSISRLISVYPTRQDNGDLVITKESINSAVKDWNFETLIVRTLPNERSKQRRMYSDTNPPYFSDEAIMAMVDKGINHLVTDLPSVDREVDGGKLLGHKAFWNYPAILDTNKTITEMVYTTNDLKDDVYLCELQILNIDLDASPSRVILYKLNE